MKKIAYVGIDYHRETVSIAVMLEGSREYYDEVKLRNEDRVVRKYLQKLSRQFELRIAYEASCSGFVFQRQVQSWGYHCDVIAPSSIPKAPGDRRKNDPRDARRICRYYASGDVSVVHPPTEDQETVRRLVPYRLSLKEDEKRVKQRINTFLAGCGYNWERSRWTLAHREWMHSLTFRVPCDRWVLEDHLNHLYYLESRIAEVDAKIADVAATDPYEQLVKKLTCLRGIGVLTAMVLLTEIGDFSRFAHPRALMAYLGLIPSEDSSGKRQKGGSITKEGNVRCRRALVQSGRHYAGRPLPSRRMQEQLKEADAVTARIAMQAMQRLHKRYWHLVQKNKHPNLAVTATTRELVGFIWALMQPDQQTAAAA